MKYTLALFAALALITGSCTSEEEPSTPSIYDEIELELNNGKKWKISHSMKSHVDASWKAIEHGDYKHEQLSEELIKSKDDFVSSCDMEGHGHDVLHDWLIPYIDLLKDYNEAKDEKSQEEALHQIKMALEVFEEYFQ
jgi:hypothetical protein